MATLSHGTSWTPPSRAASSSRTTSGTNGSKNQRRSGSDLPSFELLPDRAQFLAQLDAEPDGVVPQHLAGTSLHHLGADVQRSEQRIERRRRSVLQEAFVEAAMFNPAPLPANVAVLHMDLRGLREARELFVGRLRGDDAGCLIVEIGEAHSEPTSIDRVKLHEARPCLVKQDVIAQWTDGRENCWAL